MSDQWQGGSANWTANPTTNWSTGAEPGASDDVLIATGDPLINSKVGTVKSLIDSAALSVESAGGVAVAVTGNLNNSGTIQAPWSSPPARWP